MSEPGAVLEKEAAAAEAAEERGVKEAKKKRNVCVVGHKNPDTDSICSAISYSYLKNRIDTEFNYLPCRAGQINPETQFVLDTFNVDVPPYLVNIGTRVKDMEIREVTAVKGHGT